MDLCYVFGLKLFYVNDGEKNFFVDNVKWWL